MAQKPKPREEKSPLLSSDNEDVTSHHQYSSINKDERDEQIKNVLSEESINDTDVIIERTHEIKVYKRRWYVLLLFSCFAAAQGGIWNTWGPISDSSKDAFGWNDGDIALLSNWGPISYLISGIFFSWMIDVKGLRVAAVTSCFLVTAGAGVRCITSTPPGSTWLIHFGQFLVGLGGPVAMGGPPALSAVWFEPSERTTATAIAFLIPNLGIASGFIIGPLLVPSPNITETNSTFINSTKLDYFQSANFSNSSTSMRISQERKDIMFLMYIEFGGTLLVFLMMLIYFPKKPPLPPCASATIKRQDFWKGLKDLFKCKQFWYIATAYGTSLGVINVWTGIIDVNLSPLGVSQNEAGWIGFYSTCAACVAALVVARFADVFSKRLKLFIFILYTVGTVFIIWFALASAQILPTSTAVFYLTVIMGVMALNASVPLLFELACELAYPIGEGTTNGVMTILNNLGGLIFLFILMIPNIGTMWMNWTLIGATVVCFPLYGMLKETYNRLDIDEDKTLNSNVTVITKSHA
ncbi:solute carrier family 49 member 4 isoform X2 [Patella vulgata]|uniref:solute carrier family 49 member 4 isoform X2 n=2 Tax=Patella vulgata TaxID=6465 RepID=UPI0024A7E301|nr:solute carrier family 49 member 4 isoform X2 [Patella vulgata]